MRKTTLIVLLLILIDSFSFASSYKSNSLAQKIDSNIENSEYVLYENDDTSLLLKNNKKIKSISRKKHDKKIIVSEYNYITTETKESTYINGLLSSVVFFDSNNNLIKTINYNYEDGSMISSSVSQNDTINTDFYLRSTKNKELIGTKSIQSSRLNGDNYLIDGSNLFTKISDSMVIENQYELDEDNTIIIERDNVKYKYNQNGRLISKTTEDSLFSYDYDDDGTLICTELIKDKEKTVTFYNQAKIDKIVYYIEDRIQYERQYNVLGFGSVKTVYENDVPVAKVYYALDDMKVLKVEYIN